MDPIEIVVLILAVALVVFTIVYNVVRRRKGKSSCGCDSGKSGKSGCSRCPYCDSCRPEKPKDPENHDRTNP